jgi:hypothetical protein
MIVSNTPKEMTMSEFDKEVRALRGTVEAKSIPKRKGQCTPAEWAMNLDYQLGQGRIRRRRERQRLARAKAKRAVAKPVVVKVPADKAVAKPKAKPADSPSAIAVLAACAVDTNSLVLLKVAKTLAGDNKDVIGLLSLIEQLML